MNNRLLWPAMICATLLFCACDPGETDPACTRRVWVSSDDGWLSFSEGGCGLRQDGSILCSHGLPSTLSTPGPYVWFSGTGWSDTGTRFCAVDDASVLHCWWYGGLYDDAPTTTTFVSLPGYRMGSWSWPDGVCALRTEGTVDCWYGLSLGEDWSPERADYPQTWSYTGQYEYLYGWAAGGQWMLTPEGDAVSYDLGYPTFADAVELERFEGDFVSIWPFDLTACAIARDGTHECFGVAGACTGEWGVCNPPYDVYQQFALSVYFGCGINDDGTVRCWGFKGLSDGVPPFCGQLDPPEGRFTQISAGVGVVCGVRDDGHAVCWGNDAFRLVPP